MHKFTCSALLAALLAPALLTGAAAQIPDGALALRQDARFGPVLTGAGGRTLYIFTKDTPGMSNCAGPCAVNWPPLLATTLPKRPAGLTGRLTLVERADGTRQVAYDGQPLYYWKGDVKAGDSTGQGAQNVWFVANAGPSAQIGRAGALGRVLTGPNGLTLYTFAKDGPGVSNCTGPCESNWPPLLVSHLPSAGIAVRGKLGTLVRADGRVQVTYGGQPLYFWKGDLRVGDATGQGVMNAWTVARP